MSTDYIEEDIIIGKAEYQIQMDGDIDRGEVASSDSHGAGASFIADKITVLPKSIDDLTDKRLEELKFNWDMLWFEPPFVSSQISQYISKWDEGCLEGLLEIINDGLPGEFLKRHIEETSYLDFLKELFSTHLNLQEPSLFVDYTIGEFLTKLKDSYFPMGGEALRDKTYSEIEEKALEEPDYDYRDGDSAFDYTNF